MGLERKQYRRVSATWVLLSFCLNIIPISVRADSSCANKVSAPDQTLASTARKVISLAALLMLPAAPTTAGIVIPGQERDTVRPLAVVNDGENGLLNCVGGGGPGLAQNPLHPLGLCPGQRYRITRYLDHFAEPEKDSLLKANPKTNPADKSFPANVIGGERDVREVLTSPEGEIASEIVKRNETTDLDHRQSAQTTGHTLVVWDGPDNHLNLDPTGLGKEDLRREFVDSFIIKVSAASQPGELTLTVYDTSDAKGKIYSTATVAFEKSKVEGPDNGPKKIVPQTFRIYFGQFVGAPNGGADFSQVGAITLTVKNTSEQKSDAAIDYIALASPYCDCGTLGLPSCETGHAVFGAPVQMQGLAAFSASGPRFGNSMPFGFFALAGGGGLGTFSSHDPSQDPRFPPTISVTPPSWPPNPPIFCPPPGGGGGEYCPSPGGPGSCSVPEPSSLTQAFLATVALAAAGGSRALWKKLRR